VPEINPHAVRAHQRHHRSPNCTTIVDRHAAQAAARRRPAAPRRRHLVPGGVGRGVQGIEALREETLAWARGEAVTPSTSRTRSPST
jgi:hypothetical protein